ncbi:gas vesicle protein [Nocardioides sp. CER19]|uniref:gas vesicle protein GvpO n=1 Tax=Nocardioides sp. CER19 TaxID=3038538 RepID=UPI00244C459F|nr:gas vesicle protein [Nocardioides sp. CER19]MDH2415876.1 gas vesicle protein [Nocardioides sp. CER19]
MAEDDDTTTDDTADETTEAPAKKAPARKAAGSKTAAKKNAGTTRTGAKTAAAKAAPPRRPRAGAIAREAAAQLYELIGHEIEGITAVHRDDDGWVVEVDLLELRRIPATTDVIATYHVTVDENGDLVGYRRKHRFVRGNVGDGR